MFIEDYQYSLLSGYNTVDRELSLTGATATTYQWGYSFVPQDGVEAAFGLEYTESALAKRRRRLNKNQLAVLIGFSG